MVIGDQDLELLQVLSGGLPLDPHPYARLGETLGLSEAEVIGRLRALIAAGVIKRFGVIVRHRELGYCANAMAVWDVPDERAGEAGRRLAALNFVTLCYRRPRALPGWPYNLFCMIHGRSRTEVESQVRQAADAAEIGHLLPAVLFSAACFKQRGAIYRRMPKRTVARMLEAANGLA